MKYNFDLDLIYNNSLALIAKQIRRKTNVLEFGPANGRLTHYLKEQLQCDVYLVELDELAGREAAVYAQDIVYGDIEEYEWVEVYNDKRFDFIIFADVLEHLRNPEEVLIKAKMFLKQEGTILLSVPNIAHNSVLINLLNGQFEYTNIGLLDNTHIHFFTKTSLENMLLRAGLDIVKKMATYNEVGNNEITNTYNDVAGIDESFWKYREYGNVYQFVYEVKNGVEYVEEKENSLKKLFKPYQFKCYFNLGEGFNEDAVYTNNVLNAMGEMQFEMEVNDFIYGFQVTPLNKECIIENFLCEVLCNDAWETKGYISTNADAIEAGQYYFFHRNAQFKYETSGFKIDRIRVSFKVVTMDIHKVNLIYNTMIKMKELK